MLSLQGSMMSQIQAIRTQAISVEPVLVRCRFAIAGSGMPSSDEFCVFEFPGCERCPKASHALQMGGSEDPLKSKVWRGWIAGATRTRKRLRSSRGDGQE